ncbi:MAG: AbrB/MazE/SpoVT family DNA-binding domain-containing protein [Erysipelotrichaceae bacterium]|nr:AbrB/MazE/SpoVT family DNA-binding domain-containing protein [Erysipelotrichaceae bacterium]
MSPHLSVVSYDGEIELPQEILDRLSIEAGDLLSISYDGGSIVLKPVSSESLQEMKAEAETEDHTKHVITDEELMLKEFELHFRQKAAQIRSMNRLAD